MNAPSLAYCERCETALHTSLDSDPYILKTQLLMSHHSLRGDGYALNAYRDQGRPTCPICGFQPSGDPFSGNPPFEMGRRLSCNGSFGSSQFEFLKRHARVHLRLDSSLSRSRAPSKEYLFAHSALRHFAVAGTLSVFNGAIGPIALLNSETSRPTIQYLCGLVNDETGQGESLSPDGFQVDAFAISGGSCVVITMPNPKAIAEAHIVSIVTNASLEAVELEKSPDNPINVLYFTLELARESHGFKRTMLGEWKRDGRRNYGYGPNPNVEDFLECVERIWRAKIWE